MLDKAIAVVSDFIQELSRNEELFADICVAVCVAGLILLMIVSAIEMAKKGKADKTGVIVIFLVLFLGVAGFAIKLFIQYVLLADIK